MKQVRPTVKTITAIIAVIVINWSKPAFGDGIGSGIDRAIADNDLAKVTALLKSDPKLVFCKGPIIYGLGGYTPLHVAEQYCHKDMIELLLANKAEINATNNVGQTPLHWAAIEGHKDMAGLLLANKAEVNAKDVQDWTPLDWALSEGNKDVAELLRQHGGTNFLFKVELPDMGKKLSTRRYTISPDTFFSSLKHHIVPEGGESDTRLLRRFFSQNHIEASVVRD